MGEKGFRDGREGKVVYNKEKGSGGGLTPGLPPSKVKVRKRIKKERYGRKRRRFREFTGETQRKEPGKGKPIGPEKEPGIRREDSRAQCQKNEVNYKIGKQPFIPEGL